MTHSHAVRRQFVKQLAGAALLAAPAHIQTRDQMRGHLQACLASRCVDPEQAKDVIEGLLEPEAKP